MVSAHSRRSVARLMGIVAFIAGLALSTTAAAVPLEIGFYECGPGECAAGYYVSVDTRAGMPNVSEPLGPHFTP
jgi:hypothetical protein